MSEIFPALPICNALAIVLVLAPASWHWQAKNTGTLLYIGWTVLGNLNFMINTIVWRGTVDDLAPVWCDISARIITAQSVGLTAASLCINRKLYNVANVQRAIVTKKSKRRNAIVDLCLGILLPLIAVLMQYIVQPTRYSILENIGCWPSVLNTLLMIPLVMAWPIVISAVSFGYCTLSIRGFFRARRQFNEVLKNSSSGINKSRYFRLMALAGEEMLFALPFSIYLLTQNLKAIRPIPWISWEYTHKDYATVDTFPWVQTKGNKPSFNAIMINLWVLPGGGFLFFIWFGLSGEALATYKSVFYKIVARLGIEPQPKAAPTSKWQNQPASAPTRGQTRAPPLPKPAPGNEKEPLNEDLEAARAYEV